jgi:hypothetical protein
MRDIASDADARSAGRQNPARGGPPAATTGRAWSEMRPHQRPPTRPRRRVEKKKRKASRPVSRVPPPPLRPLPHRPVRPTARGCTVQAICHAPHLLLGGVRDPALCRRRQPGPVEGDRSHTPVAGNFTWAAYPCRHGAGGRRRCCCACAAPVRRSRLLATVVRSRRGAGPAR